MMIPEAWERSTGMSPERRAFYRYHAGLMEPWDGPASVTFCDGTVAGAVLDRNGLRPARYWVTKDQRVILSSEVGVLPIDPSNIERKGRLQPGRVFLVDVAQGRIIEDEELKSTLAAAAALRRVARASSALTRRHRRARGPHPGVRLGRSLTEEFRLLRRGPAHDRAPHGPGGRGADRARWARTPRCPCSRHCRARSLTTSVNSSPK